jgi:hypothetical protein
MELPTHYSISGELFHNEVRKIEFESEPMENFLWAFTYARSNRSSSKGYYSDYVSLKILQSRDGNGMTIKVSYINNRISCEVKYRDDTQQMNLPVYSDSISDTWFINDDENDTEEEFRATSKEEEEQIEFWLDKYVFLTSEIPSTIVADRIEHRTLRETHVSFLFPDRTSADVTAYARDMGMIQGFLELQEDFLGKNVEFPIPEDYASPVQKLIQCLESGASMDPYEGLRIVDYLDYHNPTLEERWTTQIATEITRICHTASIVLSSNQESVAEDDENKPPLLFEEWMPFKLPPTRPQVCICFPEELESLPIFAIESVMERCSLYTCISMARLSDKFHNILTLELFERLLRKKYLHSNISGSNGIRDKFGAIGVFLEMTNVGRVRVINNEGITVFERVCDQKKLFWIKHQDLSGRFLEIHVSDLELYERMCNDSPYMDVTPILDMYFEWCLFTNQVPVLLENISVVPSAQVHVQHFFQRSRVMYKKQ